MEQERLKTCEGAEVSLEAIEAHEWCVVGHYTLCYTGWRGERPGGAQVVRKYQAGITGKPF